jgi:hypothetical protein
VNGIYRGATVPVLMAVCTMPHPTQQWILPVVSAVEAGTWRAVIVRYGYGPTDFWLLSMSEVDWLPRASEAAL